MIERQILVNGLNVNYKAFGSSPQILQDKTWGDKGIPFLILHGWGSSSERWQTFGELLSEKGFFVVIPDLPGFGQSQEPATAWTMDAYVEWVKDFCEVIEELRGEFYLLGHSFGGALASKFSIKYTQRVKKLFLLGAATIRKKTMKKQLLGKISKVVKIFSFMPYYNETRKAFYKFIIRKSDYPYVKGVMKEIYLKGISEDLSHHVSFVKVPAVIIWGEKDTLTPISNAHDIHKKIPHSKLAIIPGAQHSLHREAPEMLVQKILENVL